MKNGYFIGNIPYFQSNPDFTGISWASMGLGLGLLGLFVWFSLDLGFNTEQGDNGDTISINRDAASLRRHSNGQDFDDHRQAADLFWWGDSSNSFPVAWNLFIFFPHGSLHISPAFFMDLRFLIASAGFPIMIEDLHIGDSWIFVSGSVPELCVLNNPGSWDEWFD